MKTMSSNSRDLSQFQKEYFESKGKTIQ